MSGLVNTLLPYVLTYKYVAIFIITFLGAILLPLPSGTIVMAAAAFSTQGYMNFFLVLLVGILGNVSGDHSGYWIARRYGIPTLKKIGFRTLIESEGFYETGQKISDHAIITIYLSRFMTAIAPSVNILSGLSKLSYLKFSTFEVLGEITEVSCFAVTGYLFGMHWTYVDQLFGKLWILVVAGMLFSYFLGRFLLRHHVNKKP